MHPILKGCARQDGRVQWIRDDEGVEIAVHEWPVDGPRAVVQISHGIGEHAQRYAALAADLNRAGFAVVADDHRGHGLTGRRQWGDPARMGRPGPGGLRAVVGAVQLVTRLARDLHPGLPLVLVAHSWGSLMAQMALNDDPGAVDGLVLSGTAYRMPGFMDAGDLNRRHAVKGGSGAEWLSRDPAVAQRWLDDPLTFPAQTAKLLGLRDGLRLFGRPARDLPPGLPVLLQAGTDDTLGGRRSVERLAKEYRERSGLSDVTALLYEGARHEVYNEVNRDEVVGDLVRWIEEHVVEREAVR